MDHGLLSLCFSFGDIVSHLTLSLLFVNVEQHILSLWITLMNHKLGCCLSTFWFFSQTLNVSPELVNGIGLILNSLFFFDLLTLNLILELLQEVDVLLRIRLIKLFVQVVEPLNVEGDEGLLHSPVIQLTLVFQVHHHLVLLTEQLASLQDQFTNDDVDSVVSPLE